MHLRDLLSARCSAVNLVVLSVAITEEESISNTEVRVTELDGVVPDTVGLKLFELLLRVLDVLAVYLNAMVCASTSNQNGRHGGEIPCSAPNVEERASRLDVQGFQGLCVDAGS